MKAHQRDSGRMTRNYDTTPVSLQGAANGWLSLYAKGINARNPIGEQIAGVYCLFFAVELYLKGYLALRDKRFSRQDALKNLGHDFCKMYVEVVSVAPKEFSVELGKLLKKYGLLRNNIIELRYPQAGRGIRFHPDLFNGRHGFETVFGIIDDEIGMTNWKQWRCLR